MSVEEGNDLAEEILADPSGVDVPETPKDPAGVPKRVMSAAQKKVALENLKKAREMRVSKYPKDKRDAAEKKKASLEEQKINELAERRVQELLEKKKLDDELREFRAWKSQNKDTEIPKPPPKKKATPAPKKAPKETTEPRRKKPRKKMAEDPEGVDDEESPYIAAKPGIRPSPRHQEHYFNMDDYLN